MSILRFLAASLPFIGARGNSIVTFQDETCTGNCDGQKRVSTGLVQELCERAGKSCLASGNPDEGGLAFVTVDDNVATDIFKDFEKKFDGLRTIVERTQPFKILNVETQDLEQPETPLVGITWGLDRIDQRTFQDGQNGKYEPGLDGKGVHVYVVDTGIRTTHKVFEGRAVPAIDTSEGAVKVCAKDDDSCALDTHGHGTHVAGTVGGKGVGVAPGVMLHAVKVLSSPKGIGQTHNLMPAFDWIMRNAMRPAVIQMSLGNEEVMSSAVGYAITEAASSAWNKNGYNRGLLTVVAAGNKRSDACKGFPANVKAAMAVAASAKYDKVARWSNYGKCVDIFAPGDDIRSASHRRDDAIVSMSGTSMAAPHVAGAAAMVLQNFPELDAADVAKSITNAATENALQATTKVGKDDPSNMIWGSTPNLLLYVSKTLGGDLADDADRRRRSTSPPLLPRRRRSTPPPLLPRRRRSTPPPPRRRRAPPAGSLEDRVLNLEALVRSQQSTINHMLKRLLKLAPRTSRRRAVGDRRRRRSQR